MQDLISRQAAIDGFYEMASDMDHLCTVSDYVSFLESLPSAQPEIIRCKDCKWYEDEEPGMVYCPKIVGGWVSNIFYCGYGERKESEVKE